MKGYCYNTKNEFTTLIDLKLDPLEWEINKKEVWLIPSDCTLIKPPFEKLGNEQILFFNETDKNWEVKDKKTLFTIYNVDKEGYFINKSIYEGYPTDEELKEKITIEPQKDFILPKWDYDNKKWIEATSITSLKEQFFKQIDDKIKIIFTGGFIFEIKQFSLSPNAQLSILEKYQLALAGLIEDVKVNTIHDEEEVIISKDEVLDFCKTAFNKIEEIKEIGNELKRQIRNISDIEELKKFKLPE